MKEKGKEERKRYCPYVIYEIFKLSSDVSGRWKLTGKYGSVPWTLPPHLVTPIREMPS